MLGKIRPPMNQALLDALFEEEEIGPETQPRPEFQQAWADLMNDYPEREKWSPK